MKQKRITTGITTLTGILFFTLFLGSSCTKKVDRWIDETIYDTITTLPATRILDYKVANAGGDDAVFAALDHKDKTITVYLPHYYELQYLDAEISLPAGVSISPADELVPVFSDTPFEYELTGTDGEKVKYTVKTVIQQPDFTITEFSTATNTKVFNKTSNYITTLEGTNLIPSYTVTKMYFTDASGNRVYQMPIPSQTVQLLSAKIYFNIAGNNAADIGEHLQTNTDYWIEVECYSITKKMVYPVRYSQ